MKVAHIRADAVQSVQEHLQNVATYTAYYTHKVGLTKCGEMVGGLHDIGKLTDAFQCYIQIQTQEKTPHKTTQKIDHATAGAVWVIEQLGESPTPIEAMTGQMMAIVIMSHHGGLIDICDDKGKMPYIKRLEKLRTDELWAKQYQEVKEQMIGVVDEDYWKQIFKEATQEVGQIFGEMQGFVRGKAKAKESIQEEVIYMMHVVCKYLYSALIDADRYDTATFMDGRSMQPPQDRGELWNVLSRRLEEKINQFAQDTPINQLRHTISQACYNNATRKSGIYTLNCPTGSGKTMAALRFALNHARETGKERIFYIVPFITIIEQNTAAIKQILSECEGDKWLEAHILELHSAKEEGTDEGSPEIEERELLTERMESPLIFTTMVRFLNVFFDKGTRNIRALHQFANAIIIFDEVQTLPPRCMALFNGVLNFLKEVANTTIILATATQPLLNQTPEGVPSIVLEPGSELSGCTDGMRQQFKRTEMIDCTGEKPHTKQQINQLIWSCIARDEDVLVILNTKNAVKELYEVVRAHQQEMSEEDVSIYVLSTNLYPVHRKEKIDKIRKQLGHKRLIVLSTQLIEAGVDISLHNVIRSIAGLDSIVQAAGRCNRHGEKEGLGSVYLVNPDFENLTHLPDIQRAKEVMQTVLTSYKEHPEELPDGIDSQKAMHYYFKGYYEKQKGFMRYPFKTREGRQHDMYQLLSINKLNYSDAVSQSGNETGRIIFSQSYKMAAKYFQAIDEQGKTLIVTHGEAEELVAALLANGTYEDKYGYLRALQGYSVNVSDTLLKQLGGAVIYYEQLGIYVLKEGYYDEVFGVSTVEVNTPLYLF